MLTPERRGRERDRRGCGGNKKTFHTRLSELFVSGLAFGIELRGAIPGITSENRKKRADGSVRRLRPQQLVAIGKEGKLGKDRNKERTTVTEKNDYSILILYGEKYPLHKCICIHIYVLGIMSQVYMYSH